MKIAIVMPVYNERHLAVETIKRIQDYFEDTIIVVDDGSSDDSYKLLCETFKKNEKIKILEHVINLGKGAAMKTGIEKAWTLGFDGVIFIDADGQHNPKHIPMFMEELKSNNIVFGYRELNKNMPWVRKTGNIIAVQIIRLLFGIKKKDLLSGYLAIKKSVYPLIKWESPRYGIETEMATKIGKNKLAFSEVKIDTIYVDKYKGVSLLDAIKILGNIPYWYFVK